MDTASLREARRALQPVVNILEVRHQRHKATSTVITMPRASSPVHRKSFPCRLLCGSVSSPVISATNWFNVAVSYRPPGHLEGGSSLLVSGLASRYSGRLPIDHRSVVADPEEGSGAGLVSIRQLYPPLPVAPIIRHRGLWRWKRGNVDGGQADWIGPGRCIGRRPRGTSLLQTPRTVSPRVKR